MLREVIRDKMRRRRSKLTDDEVREKSAVIKERLFCDEDFKNAKTVMMYTSAFKEPRTMPIIKKLLEDGKKVVLPISMTSNHTIVPTYLDDVSDLKAGAYGILEPSVIKEVEPSDIEVVVVPGIAFDAHKSRIGFGKGYYDKFLMNLQAKKIALCYDFQIVDCLPVTDFDVPMDLIISEEREIR